MRVLSLFLSAGLLSSHSIAHATQASPPDPDAARIMQQVALNQDRSDADRTHFLYVQHARILSRHGATVRCEEITDARIIPTPAGSEQQLLRLDGRLLVKGKYITYTHPQPAPQGSDAEVNVTVSNTDTMDRDLVENMRASLTRRRSRDGIAAGLFPLTTANQLHYHFRLVGRQPMNGHDTFHIAFEPLDRTDYDWKGEAWIDAVAFQPVLVRTTMARRVPFAVRTLLGTNLPGLGFTVAYAPQPSGIWFPVTFGTEFNLHVLFFLNREIIIDAANHDFEQTHVHSTVLPSADPPHAVGQAAPS